MPPGPYLRASLEGPHFGLRGHHRKYEVRPSIAEVTEGLKQEKCDLSKQNLLKRPRLATLAVLQTHLINNVLVVSYS